MKLIVKMLMFFFELQQIWGTDRMTSIELAYLIVKAGQWTAVIAGKNRILHSLDYLLVVGAQWSNLNRDALATRTH